MEETFFSTKQPTFSRDRRLRPLALPIFGKLSYKWLWNLYLASCNSRYCALLAWLVEEALVIFQPTACNKCLVQDSRDFELTSVLVPHGQACRSRVSWILLVAAPLVVVRGSKLRSNGRPLKSATAHFHAWLFDSLSDVSVG